MDTAEATAAAIAQHATLVTPGAAAPGVAPGQAVRPASTRAPARRRVQWDTSGKFGPVTGPVAAVLGVLAVGSIGHVAGLPPALGILGAGGIAMFDFIHALFQNHTPTAMVYRWAVFILSGGWLFAAWTWTPFAVAALVPLAVAGAGMARISWVAARKRSDAELEARRKAAAERIHERDARARDWEERIVRVGGGRQWDGVRVANIADWKDEHGNVIGDGFTLDGDCPPGGLGWRDLASMTGALASDAKLPPGCEIEAALGADQGAFWLHVPTRDSFAEYRLTDDEIVPATVMNGVDLGVTRTRTRAVIPIRESATAIVSDAGGGKTTLLHRFVLRIALCTDGLPVIIDMNNGAMGVAWCEAWWDGEAPHPVVGAIAGDAVEAFALTKFFVGVALDRKKRSGPLKMAVNQSLMPVGNGAPGQPPPLVVPIYDESAELVGADAAADEAEGMDELQMQELIKKTMSMAEKTLRVARDAGIRPVFSALKATDDFLPTSLLALCQNRIGLRLPTDADHGVLFGWAKGSRAEDDVTRKGVGKFALGINTPTTAFAAPDITPQQIRAYSIAIAHAGIGPWDLTEEDIAAGEAYAKYPGVWTRRWERAEKLFGRPRKDYQTKEAIVAGTDPAQPGEQPAQDPEPPPAPAQAGGFAELFRDFDQMQAGLDAILAEDDEPAAEDQQFTKEEVEGFQAFWARRAELEEGIAAATDPLQRAALEDQLHTHLASALRGIDHGYDHLKTDEAELARLQAAWEAPAFGAAAAAQAPAAASWRDRVLQLLDAAGPEGAAPKAIADRIQDEGRWGTTRQSVNEYLSEEARRSDAGDHASFIVRTKRGRYVHRQHASE